MKKQAILIPTADEAAKLTDRLVEIDREIKKLTAEKKGIEERLDAYALRQEQEPLKDESREGRRVTLAGPRFRLPVIFTSDILIKSFKQDSPKHRELLTILEEAVEFENRLPASKYLTLFFDVPCTWETRYDDGQKFRAAVAELLPKHVAPKFVAACTQVDKHGVKKSNRAFDYKAVEEAGKEAQ